MGAWEDAMQRLQEEGLGDVVTQLQPFEKNQLRDRAGKADAAEKRVAELESELNDLRAAPKRQTALKEANVDLSKLSPAEVAVIEAAKPEQGKEYDRDWAAKLVEQYKLPIVEGQGTEGEEPPAAAFGRPGGPNDGGKTTAKTTLKPEEVNAWPQSKRMRFIEWCDLNGKMDVYDRLLRGETVTGIAFD